MNGSVVAMEALRRSSSPETWIDNADNRVPRRIAERNQRRPDRKARHEGPRAVHGVQHPCIAILRWALVIFLADDAVFGALRFDQGAHGPLSAAVGFGDGVEALFRRVGFFLDL